MLTWEEDVQAHALRQRGWSVSAIAKHLGRDRKTIRAYLAGDREPGQRQRSGEDAFARFERYVRQRLRDDPHVQATALYDELVGLGYQRSYPTLTRELRDRGLRPVCDDCSGVESRATVDLVHEPGAECQWDWLELPEAPWLEPGEDAYLWVGALAFSSQTRAVFADATDQPHLIDAIDGVLRRFGGTPRAWRFDRMSTVVGVGTDRVLASFAAVAKHYGVDVVVCPAYRGNRKGVVEKANHLIAQRWWRTAQVDTPAQAQVSLDRFLATTGDQRVRRHQGRRVTVGELAALEGLACLPERAFPAVVEREGPVARDATVAFEGNRYGVAPGLIGQRVTARRALGSEQVEVVSPAGIVVAVHQRAAQGAGQIVRSPGQRAALEAAVLEAQAGQAGRRCHRKPHRPPSDAAVAEADRLRDDDGEATVVDLGVYQRLIDQHATDEPPAAAAAAPVDPCGCLGGLAPPPGSDEHGGERR